MFTPSRPRPRQARSGAQPSHNWGQSVGQTDTERSLASSWSCSSRPARGGDNCEQGKNRSTLRALPAGQDDGRDRDGRARALASRPQNTLLLPKVMVGVGNTNHHRHISLMFVSSIASVCVPRAHSRTAQPQPHDLSTRATLISLLLLLLHVGLARHHEFGELRAARAGEDNNVPILCASCTVQLALSAVAVAVVAAQNLARPFGRHCCQKQTQNTPSGKSRVGRDESRTTGGVAAI